MAKIFLPCSATCGLPPSTVRGWGLSTGVLGYHLPPVSRGAGNPAGDGDGVVVCNRVMKQPLGPHCLRTVGASLFCFEVVEESVR